MSKFFKKIGRGVQKGVGNFVSEAGKVSGGLAAKAGADFLMAGPEIAEVAPGAVAAYKTGGRIKGKRGSAVKIIAHAGETVLPLNATPTKSQKRVIA